MVALYGSFQSNVSELSREVSVIGSPVSHHHLMGETCKGNEKIIAPFLKYSPKTASGRSSGRYLAKWQKLLLLLNFIIIFGKLRSKEMKED